MKWIICVLILCTVHGNAISQCDSQYFRPAATLLFDASLIDTNKIIAVGDNGYIIKSTDGGKSWKNIPTFNNYILIGIQMVTDSIGYTVGSWKTILKTEDQGEHWFPLVAQSNSPASNASSSYTDLYFFDKNRGFVIGSSGMCVSTNDGGKSWQDTYIDFSESFSSITFINDSTGFIVGSSSVLYKTNNRGESWQPFTIPGIGEFESFSKVRFIDSLTGFIIGSNICLKTIDAGSTWTRSTIPSNVGMGDIVFLNDQKGFIAGSNYNGYILETNNGGDTWTLLATNTGSITSIYSINTDPLKQKVLLTGGGDIGEFMGRNGRTLLSSIDSGVSFKQLSQNRRLRYYDAFFLNDSTGCITGDNGVLFKTTDYGESWKALKRIPATYSSNPARKIFFVDELHGYAVTDNIYKTSDGGNTWNITATLGNQATFNGIQIKFWDTLTGLVQDMGKIYKTINGGSSWTDVATSIRFYVNFTVTQDGHAFAVGNNGALQVSADKGSTWSTYNLNTTKFLTSVYFYNNQLGFIGTADSTIFKTTDGGSTWTVINNTGLLSQMQTRSFFFVSEMVGYAMCNSDNGHSIIYKTINGGLSWFEFTEQGENLSHFAGINQPYLTGGNGLILKLEKLQKPTLAGYISGPDSACVNTKSSYITGPMTGVSYNWALTGGGTNVYLANRDTVLWNTAGTYTLSLSVSNACGTSEPRSLSIETSLFQPVISVQDSVLTAPEGLSYQWFRNSGFILEAQGGTAQSITVSTAGSYTVMVKSKYGCTVTTPAVYYSGAASKPICTGDTSILTSNVGGSIFRWQVDTGAGFQDIVNNNVYSGATTFSLRLANPPSAWYGYRYRCVTDFSISTVFKIQFENRWTGSADNTWENPANWSCGNLPDENTDVYINSGTVIINSDVTIKKLLLNPAANLTVQPGKTLTITH